MFFISDGEKEKKNTVTFLQRFTINLVANHSFVVG